MELGLFSLMPQRDVTDALLGVRGHIQKHFTQAGHTGLLPFAVNRSIYVTDDKDDARDAAELVLSIRHAW